MTRRHFLPLLAASATGANSAANSWREFAPLPLPRAGLISGVLGSRLLLAGGSHWENDRKILSARADFFDPATNLWTPAPALPVPRSDAASATLRHEVFAFGGLTAGFLSSSVLACDGRTWREIPAATLPQPTMYALASVLDDHIYLFSGLSQAGDLRTATNSLRRFRPASLPRPSISQRPLTNQRLRQLSRSDTTWQDLAPLPGLPRVTAAFTAHQGQLYVFGGVHQPASGPLANLAEVWRYQPSSNTWTALRPLPLARRAWNAVSFGDQILLIGGYTDTFHTDIYAYSPQDQSFTPWGQLPYPLADTRFLTLGSLLLNAGGETALKVRAPWTLGLQLRD